MHEPFHTWSAVRAKAATCLKAEALRWLPTSPLFTLLTSTRGPFLCNDSSKHRQCNCIWLSRANCPIGYRPWLRPLTQLSRGQEVVRRSEAHTDCPQSTARWRRDDTRWENECIQLLRWRVDEKQRTGHKSEWLDTSAGSYFWVLINPQSTRSPHKHATGYMHAQVMRSNPQPTISTCSGWRSDCYLWTKVLVKKNKGKSRSFSTRSDHEVLREISKSPRDSERDHRHYRPQLAC